MDNIIIIEENIDVKPFLEEMDLDDWDWVSKQKGNNIGGNKNPYGFLPLVWAKVRKGEDPHDALGQGKTALYDKYKNVQKFWERHNITQTGRAAFFRLKPGNSVGTHIDRGLYYKEKDRYHLSLQGTYLYTVGNQQMYVAPGTFFWFNNKIPHGAINVGDVDRYTLVWDVPHNKNNPHHLAWRKNS